MTAHSVISLLYHINDNSNEKDKQKKGNQYYNAVEFTDFSYDCQKLLGK